MTKKVDFDALRVRVRELAPKKQKMAELDDAISQGVQDLTTLLNTLNLGFPVEYTYGGRFNEDTHVTDEHFVISWQKRERGQWHFVHLTVSCYEHPTEAREFNSCSRDVRLAMAQALPEFFAEALRQMDGKIQEREEALKGLIGLNTLLTSDASPT